eukprot:7381653-Prymnesium_polylepis.1
MPRTFPESVGRETRKRPATTILWHAQHVHVSTLMTHEACESSASVRTESGWYPSGAKTDTVTERPTRVSGFGCPCWVEAATEAHYGCFEASTLQCCAISSRLRGCQLATSTGMTMARRKSSRPRWFGRLGIEPAWLEDYGGYDPAVGCGAG